MWREATRRRVGDIVRRRVARVGGVLIIGCHDWGSAIIISENDAQRIEFSTFGAADPLGDLGADGVAFGRVVVDAVPNKMIG